MINERPRPDAVSPVDDRACPACAGPLEGHRCQGCGATARAGEYRVRREIARTPHSRVYLAEDARGHRVALKELVFALVPDASRLEAFDREAALLRQLDHPAIPRFLASFREGEGIHTRIYLAQEFVEGTSLLDWLQSRRVGESDARQIAREVLAVLVYLHGLSPRVLHRDLKPANLLRRPDGSIAVVDFGAARDLAGGVTHGSTLVGTFGYMPPEQLGGTVDRTCDLYALGASLIHLLARRPPWELLRPGTTELDFQRAINVTPQLQEFLARLVAPRREDRFPDAESALAALDRPAQIAPFRRSRAPTVIAAAVGAAVLGGLFFVGQRTDAPQVASPPAPPAISIPEKIPDAPKPTPRPAAPRPRRPGDAEPVVLEKVAGPAEKLFIIRESFGGPTDVSVQSPTRSASGSCTKPGQLQLRSFRVQASPGAGAAQVVLTFAFQAGEGTGCTQTRALITDPEHGTLSSLTFHASPGETTQVPATFRVRPTLKLAKVVVGAPSQPDAVLELDFVARTLRGP